MWKALFFPVAMLAALLLQEQGRSTAFWITVAVALGNFWSFWLLGIMHNYRDDPVAPPFVSGLNMITSLGLVVLLIYALLST